ncbi:MAG: T9SS type A sorting domain-containing protein [Bacteroidetes bacterium]|nr:T9SS type A sorting domain-containing protein [Bacteroidota bacterium]
MKKITTLILITLHVSLFTLQGVAQNSQWLNYNKANEIRALAIEGNHLWMSTDGGLVKQDILTGARESYNKANSGLPVNEVTAIAIGEDGSRWFGSFSLNSTNEEGALVVFDGSTWTVYDTSNSGLPANNYIHSIAVDKNGTKWIGTGGGYLVAFDDSNWIVYDTSDSGLPSNIYIQSITVDVDGKKWMGTSGGGLVAFDGNTWEIYDTSNSNLPHNKVTSIAIDDNGTKWMGTGGGGLAAFDNNTWEVYDTLNSDLPDNDVTSIAIDENGTKWMGTGEGGLAALNGNSWEVYNTSNSGLPYNKVISIAIDANGTKWMGTRTFNGFWWPWSNLDFLAAFDGNTWEVNNISNSGLPDNTVTSVTIDVDGTKWMGVFSHPMFGIPDVGRGLIAFDGSTWIVYDTTNSGLPQNQITTIAIDGDGTKWVGTRDRDWTQWNGSGLAAFDGSSWEVYTTDNSELPDNYVNAIAIDDYGTKWIGTEGGLAAFDGNTWEIYNTSNSSLPYDDVHSIAIDGNGTKWMGIYEDYYYGGVGRGLAAFDGTDWEIYNMSNSGLPCDVVTSIAIDENETKWIGTMSGGLAAFDGTDWTVFDTSNSELPVNNVRSIAIEENGTKWIGTMGDGLAAFDGTDWEIYNYTNSGLPDNNVNSIAIDDNGTKWIGTDWGGLAAFNDNGIPVGIEELEIVSPQSLIVLYPNPATNAVSLVSQSGTELISLEILDIQGKVVMHQNVTNNKRSYNISHLPKGLYFFRINTSIGIEINKLVKQ